METILISQYCLKCKEGYWVSRTNISCPKCGHIAKRDWEAFKRFVDYDKTESLKVMKRVIEI